MTLAQRARIWAGVGVGLILTACVFGMAGSLIEVPDWDQTEQTGIYAPSNSDFEAWYKIALICLAAEAVLAAITIYRIYRPVKQGE